MITNINCWERLRASQWMNKWVAHPKYFKLQKQPPEVFYKKVILKNFAIFKEKHLCWSHFFLLPKGACNFIKKRLQHRCFTVNFHKFLRTPILKKHLWTPASKSLTKSTRSKVFMNLLLPNVSFWSPWKHQKTKGLLMFSAGSKGNTGKKWVKTCFTKTLNTLRYSKWLCSL